MKKLSVKPVYKGGWSHNVIPLVGLQKREKRFVKFHYRHRFQLRSVEAEDSAFKCGRSHR